MPQEDACVTERHHRTHNANYAVDNNAGKTRAAEARWITEHTDDPEEESPQSDDETTEELGRLCDSVMSKFKARTDKYNAEVVSQAQERSQNGNR